jgi:chromate reductase, NAD(P)H dehydrogenase (quinone)
LANLEIVGICGSLRKKSTNMAALRTAGELMPAGMKLRILEIGDLPLYNQDIQDHGWPAPVERLKQDIARADGLLLAAPEYNYGVATPLKNVIDWLSRYKDQPFKWKPTAIFSATGGPTGGARSQHDLRRIMTSVEAMILQKPEVYIGGNASKFDAEGRCTDETTKKFLTDQMVAFADWIARVKRFAG